MSRRTRGRFVSELSARETESEQRPAGPRPIDSGQSEIIHLLRVNNSGGHGNQLLIDEKFVIPMRHSHAF